MNGPVSPFAPRNLPDMPVIPGIRLAATEAGIKYQGRRDLLLAVFEPGTVAAGVLTQSKTRSAAVDWCAEQLKHGRARALVVNSGNANAFTGKRGVDAVRLTAEAAAKAVGCEQEEVFIASTGVIGEPLETGKFAHLLEILAKDATATAWQAAAEAIMTTDTYPKLAADGIPSFPIAGIAKGSGMIAPDMATMLAFHFTDANIDHALLRRAVLGHAQETYNRITVDSDTSTSDTVIVFATGKATERGMAPITSAEQPEFADFSKALGTNMLELAQQIVKDGEGLTKFVKVSVSGAESVQAARRIAFAIANSPLVKTAIAGEDPNWGRVIMAIGKSGEAVERDSIEIRFGEHLVARQGERASNYDEAAAAAYMKAAEIHIYVDVGVGTGKDHVWTCDLTHRYISINADYRS